jgi:deoxyribodipyrimidine photo-lyase
MHRDHRFRDNWALHFAAHLALREGAPLVAAHCLDPAYPMAAPGHFRFLLEGLDGVAKDLLAHGIALARLLGRPPEEVAGLARALDAAAVVADFDPLRHKRRWLAQAGEALPCPLHEADARNVVPCFAASDKREYMARTIRPKILKLLPEFLEEFPPLPALPRFAGTLPGSRTPEEAERAVRGLAGAPRQALFTPGEDAAASALARFIGAGLAGYASARNDPSRDGQSGLSPWLHFGMLSAQRAALAAAASDAPPGDKDAFLEELIVRRELADNFCLYAPGYDSHQCWPDWARRTLEKHADDPRPHLYTRNELAAARTHDPAWNAAQMELAATGRMHGYMRMYWAKKILEWSESPEEAHALAVELNDSLALDGRDPNGYAGVAWAIGGVHDRPWSERPVFGLIRYMSLSGLARRFDVKAYAARVEALAGRPDQESSR